jgi:hypothetical protein
VFHGTINAGATAAIDAPGTEGEEIGTGLMLATRDTICQSRGAQLFRYRCK